MSKSYQIIRPSDGAVRREADEDELRIIFAMDYCRAKNVGMDDPGAASHAIQSIHAVKAASPEPCKLSAHSQVRYAA